MCTVTYYFGEHSSAVLRSIDRKSIEGSSGKSTLLTFLTSLAQDLFVKKAIKSYKMIYCMTSKELAQKNCKIQKSGVAYSLA